MLAMRKSKLFLFVALACLGAGLLLLTGIVPVGGVAAAYVTFPLGGVFLGMYLIWRALEKESAQFDRTGHGATTEKESAACGCTDCGCGAKQRH
jgi:hypothetical protein